MARYPFDENCEPGEGAVLCKHTLTDLWDSRTKLPTYVVALTVAAFERAPPHYHHDMVRTRGEHATVVLQSVRLDVPEPSYMNFVADELADEASIKFLDFSYRTALLGSWDVLHVHWPEELLRRGERRARRLQTCVSYLLLIARIRLTRRRVVRTVHNLVPHVPGSWVESRLLELLDTRSTKYVVLNPLTPTPDPRAVTELIPHGHYRHLVERYRSSACEGGSATVFTLLFFGFIKPYKGVEALVGCFGLLDDPRLRLRISGRATSDLRSKLESTARSDARIHLELDFLSNRELSRELLAADLVVLPYLSGHNSGAVLYALSADRPVLVPDTDVHRWLARDVGEEWVLLFDAPLTAEALSRAIADVRTRSSDASPDLSGRDWRTVAQRYLQVYR